jgi:hypothetical protein
LAQAGPHNEFHFFCSDAADAASPASSMHLLNASGIHLAKLKAPIP